MRRALHLLALTFTASLLAGCGGDDPEPDAAARDTGPAAPRVDLAEAQSAIERGDIALVRTATTGDAAIATEVRPRPTDSARLEEQSGREFDLLVFATANEARAAWESVLDTEVVGEGGAAIRAVNLVAVYPEAPEDGVYGQITRSLRALATACRTPDGDAELRALCFERDADPVPPAGEGTDLDELAPIGAEVTVDGIEYRVTTARQLNPRIAPDEELVGDLEAPDDGLLFGVFLRACNVSDQPRTTSERLAIVDAFGARVRPAPSDGPADYAPTRLEPGDCTPVDGSIADRAADGRLLVFAMATERLQDRPLALAIVSEGERAAVQLDV